MRDFDKMLDDIANTDYKLLIVRDFARKMTRVSETEFDFDKWESLYNAVSDLYDKMWYLENWITEYREG